MLFFAAHKKKLIVVLAGLVLGIGVVGFWYVYSVTTTWEEESLRARVETIATALPRSYFSQFLLDERDMDDGAYVELKEKLYALKSINPDIVIYLMVRDSGTIRFVADSEKPGSELYSPPGEAYTEAPDILHDLWRYNQPYARAFFSDRWGTWASGFASVFDERGRVIGVVGIDRNGVLQKLFQIGTLASVVSIVLLLLLVIAGVYIMAVRDEEVATLKSDFLGMASHELRSPLSAVRWKLAALSRDTTTSEKMREALFEMEKHLAHVVSLSSTFLQFTSLDHNLLQESGRKEVSLNQALWSAVAKVSIQAEQKKIALWYEKATASLEGVTVFGIEEYVSLAIINVLGNAIKYSPEGSQIDIEAWVKDGNVGIVIMDRGTGIPATEFTHMYMPFMRAKSAIQSGKPGSGFGMYATNKVMKFHHGSVTHSPRVGGGTECTLTFPVYTATVVN